MPEPPKKLICITRDGHPLGMCDRWKDSGRELILGMVQEEDMNVNEAKSKARLSLYDGILEKRDADEVTKWMGTVKNPDEYLCWYDYGDLFPWSEKALEMGFRIGLFPTEEVYSLEKDRQKAKEFAKKNYPDVKVAPVLEFKKVEDAIQALNENKDTIYVLKSSGSNAETVLPATNDTDLARRQIIGALETERKEYETGKGFTLEPRIKNPIELTPIMVFWNGKPLYSVVEIENKALGAANIGRLTGGCQNLTIQTRLGCRLNQIAFPKIVYDMAKKQPGLGIYDAGLLFDGKDFYFTEFCANRPGYGGFFSHIEMSGDNRHKNSVTNHFDALTSGLSPIRWKYGVAVRLFQTEPHGKHPDMYADHYQIDWLNEVSDQLFFYCIEREKGDDGEDRFFSVGFDKDVAECSGSGNTPREAIDMAYRTANGVAMDGLYFRSKGDFLAKDYFTSIPNRLDFLLKSGLI